MPGAPGQEATSSSPPTGRLAFERHGPARGESVVCVHGLTANRSTWRAVARLVESEFRTVLVDLLARGESQAPEGASYGLESEADRLADLLATLGIRRPFLAGHSHGAAVIVACAARVQARGLLLVNPVCPGIRRPAALGVLELPGAPRIAAPLLRHFRRPLTRYTLERRVFTGRSSMPAEAVMRYAEPWAAAERARSLVSILASWDPGELAAIEEPRLPAVLVAGGRDRRVPEALARAWARRLRAELRVLTDCGHAAPEEAPAAVATALRDLVRMTALHREESDER